MRTPEHLPARRSGNGDLMNPFDMLQDRIDRMFGDFSRGFGFAEPRFGLPELWGDRGGMMPSIDMHEQDNQVVINVELPGVDEKDLDISAEDQMLTISGEKKSEHEQKDGDNYRSERSYGRFSRSVRLPFSVDADKVEARFDRGVLKLTIPKPAEAQSKTRKIAIQH